jgi:hypothetical protein
MIPGVVISIITFPGIIVHEMAHRFFCDIAKVPVYEVRYFRIANPPGYVVHGEPGSLKDSFLISVGPFIINSLLCMALTLPYVFPTKMGADPGFEINMLAWMGLSIGMHAFPSNQDMKSFTNQVKNSKNKTLIYLFAAPITAIFFIANLLKVVWIDFFYAIGISLIIPTLLR